MLTSDWLTQNDTNLIDFLGYVPNGRMVNVFMAVAIDDDIDLHPRNKRLPATRLAWAAANLAYNLTERPLSGPQITCTVQSNSSHISLMFNQQLKLKVSKIVK